MAAPPTPPITVDKIPASLWLMDISVRVFGLNPWSVLVPQALEGVARPRGGCPSGGPPPGGGPGGGLGGAGNLFFGGEPGIGRMFGLSMGTEASWLLPAALIGLVAGLWLTRGTPRTGRLRASLLLWSGWLLVTAAVFSFMDGTIHPYYTVALAPAIAALVGISVRELWRVKDPLAARLVLAAMSAASGGWAFALLERTPEWMPALRWVVLVGWVVAAGMLAAGAHRRGRATAVLAAGAILFAAAASAAYTVETVATAHNGPMTTSGQAKVMTGSCGTVRAALSDDPALAELVQGLDNRWAAASVGSFTVSSLELETGASIMAIGGFTGGDDSPTLTQFQSYVANDDVRYFIAGERSGPPGHRDGSATEITAWVQQNFTPFHVGGATVYDLSAIAVILTRGAAPPCCYLLVVCHRPRRSECR